MIFLPFLSKFRKSVFTIIFHHYFNSDDGREQPDETVALRGSFANSEAGKKIPIKSGSAGLEIWE